MDSVTTVARPPTSRHSSARPWGERTIRLIAASALVIGTAWLVWRVGWTRVDAPLWLFVPLLLTEVYAFARLALRTGVAWRVPAPARRPITRVPTVDVLVATYHEPVDMVRATLLGAAELAFPHRTYLLDDAGRPAMAALADELGVAYLTRSETTGARAGALNHALSLSEGELVLVLDADQVPMPDMLHALVGYFADDGLALVQSPVEHANRDSVLDLDESHERAFHNEVIAPGRAALGAAIWEGSASVLRRAALEDIGGVATETTTYDLATTVALHKKGWSTEFCDETLVQGLAPHNLDSLLTQRARWSRGRMASLLTRRSPLVARGMTGWQRLAYAQELAEYGSGLHRLVQLALLITVLLTGELPLGADPVILVAFGGLTWALHSLALVGLGRGHVGRGDTTRRDLLTMQANLGGLGAIFQIGPERFRPVARTGVDSGGLQAIVQLRLLTILTIVLEASLILRMLDSLVGWPLTKRGGSGLVGMIGAAIYMGWMCLTVLGVFVGRRQHRSAYRQRLDHPAYADGNVVRIRDLSPLGVALVSTQRYVAGQRMELRMRLPDLKGAPHDITATVVVRGAVPNQDESRWRLGCRFVDLAGPERDVVVRYCSIVRPFQHLRSQSPPKS